MEQINSKIEELTRAFIAIEVPDSVIKEVARTQEILVKQNFIGKMTELENLHLTLRFLGEIDNEKLERAGQRLREIKFNFFEAKLSEIGIFNYRGNPRIVWIKIGGKEVFELQNKIDDSLAKEGFAKEERFMSHMTIARVKYVKDKKFFLDYVKNIGIKNIKFDVDKFYLKKSELKESGPIYKDLETFNLEREI